MSDTLVTPPNITKPGRFAGGIVAPLANINFCLLFSGQTVSTIGDAFYAVALPWLILSNNGSAQDLGIVLTAYGIPKVATILLGGVLSDKLRPRRVMLIADAARAVLVGLLALLALGGHPTLWQLCAIAVPLGAFGGLFLPASFSMIPEILDDADLQAGNALNTSSIQLATLLGSALAGVVVASAGSSTALLVDALTFVVSAVSLALLREKKRLLAPNATTEVAGEATPTAAGAEQPNTSNMTFWQLLRTSKLVQVALLVVVVANLSFGATMEVALPALVHGPLAAGANGFGFILAAFGAGALIGGLVSGTMGNLRHRGLIGLLFGLVQAIAYGLIPYAGGLVGAIVCMGLMGFTNSISNVLFLTLIQQVIPRHLLGRMMGMLMFASFGTYPLSVAVGGVATTHFGPVVIFPVSGAMLFGAILFGLLQRELREL